MMAMPQDQLEAEHDPATEGTEIGLSHYRDILMAREQAKATKAITRLTVVLVVLTIPLTVIGVLTLRKHDKRPIVVHPVIRVPTSMAPSTTTTVVSPRA